MKTLLLFCTGLFIAAVSQAQIIHVPGDYPSIQQGINAATNGDTVLVSDGLYYEQINFLGKKPLMVASEYLTTGDTSHIANTIIDGSQITDSINGSIVIFKSGEDTTSVLCGFTILNGNIGTLCNQDSVDNEINARVGGGIFIYNCGAKLIHNHITENHIIDADLPGNPIDVAGGGIYHGPNIQDEHWVVLDGNSVDLNSTHSGSTISMGAGVIVQSNSIISNNIISGNIATSEGSAFSWGGGLVGTNNPYLPSNVQFTVKNNIINDNQVISDFVAEAAGAVFEHSMSLFSNNIVEYNIVDAPNGYTAGTLILRPKEGSLVSGNFFQGNATTGWQGGLLIFSDYSSIYQDTATVIIENNYFISNDARNGGGMQVENTLVILQNNVFARNHALISAGAVRIYNTLLPVEHMVTIINNSFSGNKADVAGGAIFSNGDKPLVINSIFWHDSSAAGYGSEIHLNQLTETVEIANSNIDFNLVNREVVDGGGNINEDPLFSDQDLLIPNAGSPCIDAGIDAYTCTCGIIHNCPEYDILDSIRPLDEGFDMGAYEVLLTGMHEIAGNNAGTSLQVYPNPSADKVTISLSGFSDNKQVSIFKVSGEKLIELQTNDNEIRLDISALQQGAYFVRVKDDKGMEVAKMIKQ